jgi:hypothetical protein
MQKKQAVHSNEEVAGSTLYCRSSRRYTVMQKQHGLHSNEEVTGATQ